VISDNQTSHTIKALPRKKRLKFHKHNVINPKNQYKMMAPGSRNKIYKIRKKKDTMIVGASNAVVGFCLFEAKAGRFLDFFFSKLWPENFFEN